MVSSKGSSVQESVIIKMGPHRGVPGTDLPDKAVCGYRFSQVPVIRVST